MNETAVAPPPVLPEAAPSAAKVLRRLFLTLFLRGRGARGLTKRGAPTSVFQKLALTLFFYALFGCMALAFLRQPVFALAAYMHAMTFVFLGMFVASSAGEILFNKEEADILLHRPVTPQIMLWAKIRVLVEVSLWLAGAFNLAALVVGFEHDSNWRFPIIHIVSTTLEALFCTGSVVLIYQLCLRWFGRERLEGLMTTAQVLIAVAAVVSGQILPRLLFRFDHVLNVSESSWWIAFLPPAWFAGLDDAFAGSSLPTSWLLAAIAVIITAAVLWLAFSKLARDYEVGQQLLGETVSPRIKTQGKRRWLDKLVSVPPFSWWLRDPVSRASFLLTAAYLVRDRDVKLRVYPGIAPMLVIPFVFLFQDYGHKNSGGMAFGIPFSGVYLGLVPFLGLQILQYSQQWQAADVFRVAPIPGPALICHGARRAVLFFLALPMVVLMGLIVWLLRNDASQLLLFIPGLIALPVFALIPNIGGKGVPLSVPGDAAKAAGRGLGMMGVMVVSFALAGVTQWAWRDGWFRWFVLAEAMAAIILYVILRLQLDKVRWPSLE
jgi:ABC-2 type transport system permease protein